MSGTVWRLILDGPVQGAMNMALDRAVLRGVAVGTSVPTLRLYRWEVPTVTLGRFQSLEQVDIPVCECRGFDIVRRPTGGRGVLHDDELTYGIVAGTRDGVPSGVAASYRYLSAALAEAYATLGVPAQVTARSRGERGAGACYLHATQADLSLGAAKLSGSAQVWKEGAVLQHGSFVVSRDVDAEAEVFRLDPQARDALDRTTATLEGVLGRSPSFDEIRESVVGAFERTFGVTLQVEGYSEEELARAAGHLAEHEILTVPRRP